MAEKLALKVVHQELIARLQQLQYGCITESKTTPSSSSNGTSKYIATVWPFGLEAQATKLHRLFFVIKIEIYYLFIRSYLFSLDNSDEQLHLKMYINNFYIIPPSLYLPHPHPHPYLSV
jgi:hypothetical protein